MSIIKTLANIIKSFPSSTNAAGLEVLLRNSNGALIPVSIATLAAAIADTGKMMRTVIFSKNTPIDANDLIQENTVYTVSGDMVTWNADVDWLNFPKSRPIGGFTLLNIKEGSYLRQFYSFYMDNHVYMRYMYYTDSKRKWSPWREISSTAIQIS